MTAARQPRRFVGAAVVVLALVAVQAVGVQDAEGFGRPTNQCHDGSMTYKFVNSGGETWTSARKSYVNAAVADWKTVLDYNGTTVVDSLTETTGSADVELTFHASPGGSSTAVASAECVWPQATISFDSDVVDTWSSSKWEHIARHEFGHLMGMEHTGDDDSFGGPLETMATCISFGSTSLSQDDHGNITHKLGNLDPETLHANAGFEVGTTYWGKTNVTDFYQVTSGSADGNDHLRFRPTSANGYVYQTMNYAASGAKRIDARVNAKKIVSWATTGTLTSEIYVREVDYASGGSCSWPTGRNQNSRTDGVNESEFFLAKTSTYTPGTSWNWWTSTTYTIPTAWRAADLRIRVKSNVKYTQYGTYATIAIDTARVRDRS